MICDNGCFNDQTDATATNTNQHEWLSADFVQEYGTDGVEDDADSDPAALEFQLLFASRV